MQATRRRLLLGPGLALLAGGPRRATARGVADAPLFAGLDGLAQPVDSDDALARRYVRQGLMWAFAFNFAESARSFDAAARRDPRCGAAHWGRAWALGPNINSDPGPGDGERIAQALREAPPARFGAPWAGLLAALARRHPDTSRMDEPGYAAALGALAGRHPRDALVQLLAAEAQLNLHPYDWWQRDGRPQPWTPAIERLLARALALDPRQPGAHHYAIHLYESSPAPGRAEASARFLREAFPGAPHLLHMPSHIDLRLGRYAEAIAANRRAIAADEAYLAQVDAQGAYRVGYVAHNHHFLWAAACMAGRREVALPAADAAGPAACGPGTRVPAGATVQHLFSLPATTRWRFAMWPELASGLRPPDDGGAYALALWHAARAAAFAQLGRPAEAREQAGRFDALAAEPALREARVKNLHPAPTLLAIAGAQMRAELALAAGDAAAAIAGLRAAVEAEDGLAYDEPHPVAIPSRQALASALSHAGRWQEALAASEADLRRHPGNAWSLAARAQVLQRLGGRRPPA